jgi:hypothetical protein
MGNRAYENDRATLMKTKKAHGRIYLIKSLVPADQTVQWKVTSVEIPFELDRLDFARQERQSKNLIQDLLSFRVVRLLSARRLLLPRRLPLLSCSHDEVSDQPLSSGFMQCSFDRFPP